MRSDSLHRPSSTSSPVGERHECISDGHGRRSDRTVRTGGGPGPRRERVVAVAEFGASLLTVHVPARMRRADTHSPLVLDTTELRWFVPGSLPAEVAVWFTGSTGVLEERSDTYLLDGRGDVGVKRRFRQTVELEVRQSLDGRIEFGDGLAGSLEVWRRWSPAEDLVEHGVDERWVDVHKSVVKRRFLLDGTEGRVLPGRGSNWCGMRRRGRRGHHRRRPVVDVRVRCVRPASDATRGTARLMAGVGGRSTVPGTFRASYCSSNGLPGMAHAPQVRRSDHRAGSSDYSDSSAAAFAVYVWAIVMANASTATALYLPVPVL